MALKLKAAVPAPVVEEPDPPSKSEGKKSSGNLADIIATFRKDKGDKVIVAGNQISVVRRLPTGIFEFDFYIGGGFPCGRYSIIYGPESSCKTNLCLKAVASAQKLPGACNKAVWVNIEQSFDPIWAEKLGVDTSKLMVVEAGYGEEAIDIVDALVRAEDLAILVVDSMAGLIASKEIANSVEKYDIGTSALLIKRMVNKLMIAFCEERKRNHDPCVILINQTRFKPGVLFGDPETMPGGEAQKFLSSLRVRVRATNEIDKATNTLVFKKTHATIKKAKVPVRAADFDFAFCVHDHDDLKAGETDSFNMVKSHLQALGLLTKETKGYKLTAPASKSAGKGVVFFPTLTAIRDEYQKDQKFRAHLQKLVIDAHKDHLLLVEEADFSPNTVAHGDVTPVVQSSAYIDKTTGEEVT